MKSSPFVLWSLFILALCDLKAMAADPSPNPYDRNLEPAKSFHLARAHLETGEYEKAHAIHQQMFSDIESLRPKVFDLYVHNLTYDWHQVAIKHPPAMVTLLSRRDLAEKKVRSSAANPPDRDADDYVFHKIAFSEVTGFNEWLGEDIRTADLYIEIEQQSPEFARSLYFYVRDVLLRAGRHDILALHEPSPEKAIQSAGNIYTMQLRTRPDLKPHADRHFIRSVTRYIDVYNGTGDVEKAEKARALGLEILDSPKIRDHGNTKSSNANGLDNK